MLFLFWRAALARDEMGDRRAILPQDISSASQPIPPPALEQWARRRPATNSSRCPSLSLNFYLTNCFQPCWWKHVLNGATPHLVSFLLLLGGCCGPHLEVPGAGLRRQQCLRGRPAASPADLGSGGGRSQQHDLPEGARHPVWWELEVVIVIAVGSCMLPWPLSR